MLYLKYMKMHFKSAMQYKLSFILSFFSQVLGLFGYYFTVLCLFTKFSNVKGFSLYEVLFAFGIIQFGSGFGETFFRGLDKFDTLILKGSYDKVLLRPRNLILQVLGEDINFLKASKIIEAIIVFIIVFIKLDIEWNILKVITFICMIISSITIFFGLFLLATTYCFITVKGLEIRNVLTNGCKSFAQYPIGIFKRGFVFFLSFIIPFGFVNYYPLLYVLGRVDNGWLSISPLITLLYLIPVIWLFYKGNMRYTSTGS